MTGIEPFILAVGAASAAAGAGVAIHQAMQDPTKPPELPKMPKPPTLKGIDRTRAIKASTRQSARNSTILGGYSGTDANLNRPSLLGE